MRVPVKSGMGSCCWLGLNINVYRNWAIQLFVFWDFPEQEIVRILGNSGCDSEILR